MRSTAMRWNFRTTKVTLPDNSATTYSYATNTTTITDAAGKQSKSVADAGGRLSSVFEPDPANGNSLTVQTSYAYNVLDELTQVTEGAQTRTYAFDALGRLLSSTTPEAGRVCLGSVTSGTCNADGYDSFDNLQKKTDARGVLTSYGYDGLNRLKTITYNVGTTGVPATASVSLTYGTSAAQFNNGRLITMTDGVGWNCFAVKGTFFNKTQESNWKVAWHQDLTILVRERREVHGFGPWTVKAGIVHVQPPASVVGSLQ